MRPQHEAFAPCLRHDQRVSTPALPFDRAVDAGRQVAHRIGPRRRLRMGVDRLRDSWWSIAQSALAGAVAWEVATRVVGHTAPFFASVAAIVCLSSYAKRLRRVGEIAVGVTLGVGIGDVIVREIGRGGWQLALVVVAAMAVALLLDGAQLIVNQAALQAVFVVALPVPTGGYLSRWEDALIGGATALVIAFLLPADPLPALRRDADDVVRTVAATLRACVAAARAGDAERAGEALERLRTTQPQLDAWRATLGASEETSRLSPLRRGSRAEIAAHRRGLAPFDRAVRNLRVAVRRVAAAVDDEVAHLASGRQDGEQHGLPEPVLAALESTAGVVHTVPGALRDAEGEGGRRLEAAARELAARLDPEALDARSLSATVVVAQLRSAVVDLLQITGTSPADAKAALPR